METTQSDKANTNSNSGVIPLPILVALVCVMLACQVLAFIVGFWFGSSEEKDLQEIRKQNGIPVYFLKIREAEEFCNGHGGLFYIDVGERKKWYQDTMDKITCADKTWVYSHQIQK